MGWADGDFSNHDVVHAIDAAILAANWGHGAPTQQGSATTSVPEPGVLAMLACLVLLAGGRRRRVM